MVDQRKTYELNVELREQAKNASRKLALSGLVPGVVYGHNVEPQTVAIPQRELDRVYLRAGSNSLVDLRVGGATAEPRKVFIHEVQRHPQTHLIRHVDFIVVNLREEMHATVPLVIIGESPIVAANEGLLISQLDHLEIRALPGDIPSQITVDVSGLDEVGKSIHVGDLSLPDNVTLLSLAEEVVVTVTHMPTVSQTEADEAAEAAEGAAGENAAEGGAATES